MDILLFLFRPDDSHSPVPILVDERFFYLDGWGFGLPGHIRVVDLGIRFYVMKYFGREAVTYPAAFAEIVFRFVGLQGGTSLDTRS